MISIRIFSYLLRYIKYEAYTVSSAEALKSLYGEHKRHRIVHRSIDQTAHFSGLGNNTWRVTLAGALHLGKGLIKSTGVGTMDFQIIETIDTLSSTISGVNNPQIAKVILVFSNTITNIREQLKDDEDRDSIIAGIEKVKRLELNKQLEFCLKVIMEREATMFMSLGSGSYRESWHSEYFT